MNKISDNIQNLPLKVKDFTVYPFREQYIVKNLIDRTYIFIDEEDLFLVNSLKDKPTLPELVRKYQQKFGKYSFKKIYRFIVKLMGKSFFESEVEKALCNEEDIALFKPRKKPSFKIPAGLTKLFDWSAPLVSKSDSLVMLIILFVIAVFSSSYLITTFPNVDYIVVKNSMFLGFIAWIIVVSVIISLRNLYRYLLLHGKKLETPLSSIVFRKGIILYQVYDGDILTLNWKKTMRFHLACLLFPSLLSLLCILLVHIFKLESNLLKIGSLASVLIVFINLSPFHNLEFTRLLDRMAGKSPLLKKLDSFLSRKFLKRIFSFKTSFQYENQFIVFSLFSISYLYAAYRIVNLFLERYMGTLIDSMILSKSILEQVAVILFLTALFYPFIYVLGRFISIIAINFYSINKKSINSFLYELLMRRFYDTLEPEEIQECLKKVPLFADMSQEDLVEIASCMKVKTFPRNTRVIWQGDKGTEFYVIYKGKAKIVYEDETGRETQLFSLAENDSFGEMALLQDIPRTASVITLERSICLVLDKYDFNKFIDENIEKRDQITKIIRLGDYLNDLPLFEEESGEILNKIIPQLYEKKYEKGDIIIAEGDIGEDVLILKEGFVSVWRDYKESAAEKINEMSPGEIMGEIALFERIKRTATVVAETDCEVIVFPGKVFSLLIEADLSSGILIEELVGTRNRRQD